MYLSSIGLMMDYRICLYNLLLYFSTQLCVQWFPHSTKLPALPPQISTIENEHARAVFNSAAQNHVTDQ